MPSKPAHPDENAAYAACLEAIARAADVPQLREATIAAFGSLGYAAAYFVTPPRADERTGRITATFGLSPVWDRHYRERLHLLDPLPEIALGRVGAFAWPADIDKAALDPRQRRFLRLAARFGLPWGVGTMCYGPNGRCGFLTAVGTGDPPEAGLFDLLEIHAIGQIGFQRYCQLVPIQGDNPRLSRRETDVLRLISQGMSNGLIAEALGIKPTSVDAYVRRIFTKLAVSDRTTASVKAQSLGLIASWDHERLMREAAERLPLR